MQNDTREDDQREMDREQFVDEFQGLESEKTEEQRQAEHQAKMQEVLQVFGNGIETEAEEFERLRKPIETRMLEDMRQYMGVDGDSNERRVKAPDAANKSDINVNITRKKTNAAEARLSDMLFPNDDKNWALDPTPVPTLAHKGEGAPAADQQPADPAPSPQAAQMVQAGVLPPEVAAQAQQPAAPQEDPAEAEMRIAKHRAELMEKEMDDQLTESKYPAMSREAIRSGCQLGTGVLKGPVLVGKTRRAWVKKADEKGNVAHVLQEIPDLKPGYEFVPIWDFFPTLSATRIEDSEVNYQRHWMTRRDLIKLAKREDFMTDQIRQVLRKSPSRVPPDYLTQLRSITGVTAVGDEKRYVVWERHGPIDPEALQACGLLPSDQEIDPLMEFQGIVWVCQGVVIKAAINPLETEDNLFSVFNLEKDDSSIFGYGVPFLTRESQRVVTQAWRMIMDNAGLSVGGQIIVNKSIVEPAPAADGTVSWDVSPLKTWLLTDKHAKAQDAFHIFEFPNHQNEMAAIFNMARQLADEESGIPPVAEGESGAHQTTTAHGMEMLMNSHNIVMRRAVSNWDDGMTVPNITRLYDWNMQNNPNNEIKGDYSPKATGSTALLQKETQARNMLNLVNFLMNPNFGGAVKTYNVAKKLVVSMQHDPDELLKTEAEFNQWMEQQAQAAEQQGGGDVQMQIQQMRNDLTYKMHQDKLADREADRQYDAYIQDRKLELEAMKLASKENVEFTKANNRLQELREKNQAARTLIADKFKSAMHLPAGKVAG